MTDCLEYVLVATACTTACFNKSVPCDTTAHWLDAPELKSASASSHCGSRTLCCRTFDWHCHFDFDHLISDTYKLRYTACNIRLANLTCRSLYKLEYHRMVATHYYISLSSASRRTVDLRHAATRRAAEREREKQESNETWQRNTSPAGVLTANTLSFLGCSGTGWASATRTAESQTRMSPERGIVTTAASLKAWHGLIILNSEWASLTGKDLGIGKI